MPLSTKYNHCSCDTRIDFYTEIDFFNAITDGVTVYHYMRLRYPEKILTLTLF